MGNLSLAGATSGQITLSPPSVAGTNTLSLPAATGTLIYGTQPSGTIVGTTDTQTLTNKTLTSPNIGGTPVMNTSVITSATVQNSTSGTSIDFTGIPSWVKRVTVMFNGVSINATTEIQIQIGSGSFTTTGYGSSCARLNAGGTALPAAAFTSGFQATNGFAASGILNGFAFIVAMPSNSYGYSSNLNFGTSGNTICPSGGSVTLAGALDRVRITTVSGTAAFNAGSINIMYE
jgi:hypothetical protein